MAQPASVGDCDGNGAVAINELVTGVRIALERTELAECPAFDVDGNGRVSVSELVQGVMAAQRSVSIPSPTPTVRAACVTTILESTSRVERHGTTTAALDQVGGARCDGNFTGGGSGAPDVVYEYVAPAAGEYEVRVDTAPFDSLLVVNDGDCMGIPLGCDDRAGSGRGSLLEVTLTAGQRVAVIVDGARPGQRGPFRLGINLKQPDLVLTDLSRPPEDLISGDEIALHATVENRGTINAGPFDVTFVFANDPALSDVVASDTICSFDDLSVGSKRTCQDPSLIVPLLPTATYYFGAVADLPARVREEREDNNSLGVAVHVEFDISGPPAPCRALDNGVRCRGGEFQVNQTTTGTQISPAVAMAESGDFVVVWSSGSVPDTDYDIYGQRFARSGERIGGEFRVNASTTGDQGGPAVAATAAGDFVVVWSSRAMSGVEADVMAQRFASAGEPIGSEFTVNSLTTGEQFAPAVAVITTTDFVVAWLDWPTDLGSYRVVARRFSWSGEPLGEEIAVTAHATDLQFSTTVAAIPTGGFVVVWESFEADGESVRGHLFTSQGERDGNGFQINSDGTYQQASPAVTATAGGEFVVVWEKGDASFDRRFVLAQRYSSGASEIGSAFLVSSYFRPNRNHRPKVAATATGDFVVVWDNFGRDEYTYGVRAQRFTSTGAQVGAEFGVNSYPTGDQKGSAVAANGAGDFVVVWDSRFQDEDGSFGVFAQAISLLRSGSPTPASAVVPLPARRESDP